MKKRTERDVIEKAIPDLLGDKNTMVRSNFVEFWVPKDVFDRLNKWLDAGDEKKLRVARIGFNHGVKQGKIIIINEDEQRAYLARGGGVNDNDPDKY